MKLLFEQVEHQVFGSTLFGAIAGERSNNRDTGIRLLGHLSARCGWADELPPRLPRPAVPHLQHDVQHAHRLQRPRHGQRPSIDRPKPSEPTSSRILPLAAASSPATKPSSGTPSTTGSACLAASAVLNAFTTRAPGTRAWICSALEEPSRTAPGSSGFSRLVTSTTTLPSSASPSSPRTPSRAGVWTASTTTSAFWTAVRLEPTAVAPTSRATAPACSGVAAQMVTA